MSNAVNSSKEGNSAKGLRMGAGSSVQIIREGASDIERDEWMASFKKFFEAYERKKGELSEEELAKHLYSMLTSPDGTAMAGETSASSSSIAAENVEKKCLGMLKKIVSLNSQSYLFAFDDSEGCKIAFDGVMDLFKGDDFINLVHVDDGKSNWDNLKLKYETHLCTKLPSSHYSLTLLKDDTSPANVKSRLVDYVSKLTESSNQTPDEHRPDITIFACGFVGKKSPDGSAEIMGSTTDLGLRTVPAPCLVMKKPFEVGSSKLFILLTNGKKRSWNSYRIAMQLLKPKDRIEVVHFHQPGADFAGIKNSYEMNMQLCGIDGTFTSVEAVPPPPTEGNDAPKAVDKIRTFLMERGPDVVVLAPRPSKLIEDKKSLTQDLMQNLRANFLLVKSEEEGLN